MRQDWEIKNLGEVCLVERGSSPRPIDNFLTENPDGVNWIKIGDTKGINKFLYSTKEKISIEGAKRSRFVKEGDFILSNSMSFGNPFIMKTQGYIHDGWFVLRLHPFIESNYFYYLLSSPNVQAQIKSLASGAIVKNISSDLIKKVKVVYPSLQEQQLIVVIIDEAFENIAKLKANAEQNLKNAKELFESYLQSVFDIKGDGWKEKTLNEVCLIVNGGTPDTKVAKYWDGEHLWLTPKDMGKLQDIYVYDTSRKITDAGLKNSSAKILPNNSVILSSRAPIGHLAINKKPVSTNQGCKGLVPQKDISSLFIFYFLKRSVELLNNLGTGTTFKELSGSKLSEVKIPMPRTLNEQLAIVQKLDSLSAETKKLEAIYQQKLNDLEELKKSILQKAFNGEL